MNNLFFTADLHLNHSNIIKYCNRPFLDSRVMDEVILKNINDRVAPNDILWILGDFCFARGSTRQVEETVAQYRAMIECKNVHLVIGNHDPKRKNYEPEGFLRDYFLTVTQYAMIRALVNGSDQSIFMIHYAGRIWPHSHHGAWQLWGHSHGTLSEDPNTRSIDVGIDAVAFKSAGIALGAHVAQTGERNLFLKPENYRPMSLQDVTDEMAKKKWKPIDHHGAEE